jgi:hypothetical protein
VISGIISLVTQSEAEKRWDAYQKLRTRLTDEKPESSRADDERDADRVEASFDLAPVRGGAAAVMRARF